MIKKLSIILLVGLFFFIFYISYVGVETNAFNKNIKERVKNSNQDLNVNFSKVKIFLKLTKLEFDVKLIDVNFNYDNSYIYLTKLNTVLSIKNFFQGKYPIKYVDIGVNNIKIREIINLINKFEKFPILIVLRQVLKAGNIDGEAKLFFDSNGKIKNNYKIEGFLQNVDIELLNGFKFENISSNFKINTNTFNFKFLKKNILGVNLEEGAINILRNKNNFKVSASVKSIGDINKPNYIFKLLNIPIDNKSFDINKISFNLKNTINFDLKKFILVENFSVISEGEIKYLDFKNNFYKYKKINKFTDHLNDNFIIKKNKILFKLDNNIVKLQSNGLININNKDEIFSTKIYYEKKNQSTFFDFKSKINSINLKFNDLNYIKKINSPASFNIKGNLNNKNKLSFKEINFSEGKNSINVKNLKLNNFYQIQDIDELKIKTNNNNFINNDFYLKKDKKNILISGKVYDGNYFFKNIYKDKKKIIANSFEGHLKINIDKILNKKKHNLYDLSATGDIKKGKIVQLKINSKFSNKEFLNLTIKTDNQNKKKTIFISDRAEPFIENFTFINDFKGGKLEYISASENNLSVSNLKISKFKIKDAPLLTKLLTLASLQGVVDLMTGEGIRFDELEMDFNSNDELMKIEELYAIGPSISLLISGYIEKENLISLRGTLVPATTINRFISSIPILGNILIGKKTGEGIFGVSFKIKGPPKNLRTVVNPIKTLTPRFITRTLEKIKKN